MPSITLRGLPDHLHETLRTAADDAHRSLNSELLHRIEASVHHPPPPPYAPGPEGAGPPDGWRPHPPSGGTTGSVVGESRPTWGRTVVDATVTPVLVAIAGHSIEAGRQSVMLVASEPLDGWLNLEWHWIRAEGEEAVPSGSARISIEGLSHAALGGSARFDREDVVALVADMALDALGEARRRQPPLRRITRFETAPPAALLRLRIDPATRVQLEAVRDRTRLPSLRPALDHLLAVQVEVLPPVEDDATNA